MIRGEATLHVGGNESAKGSGTTWSEGWRTDRGIAVLSLEDGAVIEDGVVIEEFFGQLWLVLNPTNHSPPPRVIETRDLIWIR